jgi:hypothetical protein
MVNVVVAVSCEMIGMGLLFAVMCCYKRSVRVEVGRSKGSQEVWAASYRRSES